LSGRFLSIRSAGATAVRRRKAGERARNGVGNQGGGEDAPIFSNNLYFIVKHTPGDFIFWQKNGNLLHYSSSPMSKKHNHTAEPSKLTRFRSFEEMKSAPDSFPSSQSPAQRQAEYNEVIAQLRSSYSVGKGLQSKKTNKKIVK
jgi:hypothetical protein